MKQRTRFLEALRRVLVETPAIRWIGLSFIAMALPTVLGVGYVMVANETSIAKALKARAFTITTDQRMRCYHSSNPAPEWKDMTRIVTMHTDAFTKGGDRVRKVRWDDIPLTKRTIDWADGRYAVAIEEIAKKSELMHPSGRAQVLERPSPDHNCLLTYDGHPARLSSAFDGFDTVGSLRTVRLRHNSQGWDKVSWYAIDYGCTLVKEDSTFTPPRHRQASRWRETPDAQHHRNGCVRGGGTSRGIVLYWRR